MTKIRYFVFAAAAALAVGACAGDAPANDANAASTAARTAQAAPTNDALVALEKGAFEAWKTRDASFWDGFLADEFVGYGSSGRIEKAAATREYTGADCEIESYALSDEQMRPLGKDAALLTYKTTVDGTCGGQRLPANSWAASIYVRADATWKGAFHAAASIVDPGATPAIAAVSEEAPEKDEAKPAAPDAGTDALVAAEKALWEAWKDHDAERIEELTTEEISFINIFGTYFATKADAIEDWTGPGCEVQSVSVTDGVATMLSPTVAILRHTSSADGTCFGQEVGSVWGTSVYVKDGDAWKWAFGINLPAPREGS